MAWRTSNHNVHRKMMCNNLTMYLWWTLTNIFPLPACLSFFHVNPYLSQIIITVPITTIYMYVLGCVVKSTRPMLLSVNELNCNRMLYLCRQFYSVSLYALSTTECGSPVLPSLCNYDL